jgi:hypothetical protein
LGWLPPEPFSCAVNSGFEEFSPSLVVADGVTALFFSSNRSGLHKVYMSVLQPDGQWAPATEVTELSCPGAQDARPNVRKDGLEIVFDSTRVGAQFDIYTATRSSIFEPWSAPVRSLRRSTIGRIGNTHETRVRHDTLHDVVSYFSRVALTKRGWGFQRRPPERPSSGVTHPGDLRSHVAVGVLAREQPPIPPPRGPITHRRAAPIRQVRCRLSFIVEPTFPAEDCNRATIATKSSRRRPPNACPRPFASMTVIA